jgi:hypothetical protein
MVPGRDLTGFGRGHGATSWLHFDDVDRVG